MARMYSRKKGKHGSKKPLRKSKPSWVRYEKEEIEQLILKLAKADKTPSQIGLILRDSYGVPDVKKVLNKRITKILEENNVLPKLPEDFIALMKKQMSILKHLEVNKKDMPSRRGLTITESKIKKLADYYKRVGKLPKDWKYDREKAKLIVG